MCIHGRRLAKMRKGEAMHRMKIGDKIKLFDGYATIIVVRPCGTYDVEFRGKYYRISGF